MANYAIAGHGLIPFLKAMGVETEGLMEATIHIAPDDVVTVTAKYAPRVNVEDVMEVSKNWILFERSEENQI